MVDGHHVCWPGLDTCEQLHRQLQFLSGQRPSVIKASFSVIQHLIELQMSLNERGEQHAPPPPSGLKQTFRIHGLYEFQPTNDVIIPSSLQQQSQ